MVDFLIRNDTSIILANSGDHAPTAGNGLLGTQTDQLDLTSLAAQAWRQSAKFDFSSPRAEDWIVRIAIQWSIAPSPGNAVNIFLGFSDDATAGNNNPGNLSGADAAYTGYGGAAADAVEASKQLVFVGSLVATNDVATQVAEVGVIGARLRYGIIAIQNDTDQAFIGNGIQMSVHLIPVNPQSSP